jgi:hypothetical protein
VTPGTATGRITFYDGVTVLGIKPLVSGAASLSTILLPAGNRKLRAYYSGDAANSAATSNIVTQNVNAQPSAGFAVGGSIATPATILLAQADFNGDGKADLVVSNDVKVSILLGDGNGNFSQAFSLLAPSLVVTAAVGDFNGDGIPDLVYFAEFTPTVAVILGKGDGTFQSPVNYPLPNSSTGSTVGSLVVADFNGDGKADIGAADLVSGVAILLGKGDGTFQPAVSYAANPQAAFQQATFVVVADFNGDGKPDLATVNNNNATMSILLGVGDGTFQPATIVALPTRGYSLAVADFNGDGKADIANVDNGGVDILLGNGDGTFQKPVSYSNGGRFTGAVSVGDFNGDGITDLALVSGGSVSILLGNGDGTFQLPVSYAAGAPGVFPSLVGDFNGDGKTDLASASGNTVSLLLGTTVTVTPTAGTPQSVTITKPFPTPLQVTVKDGATPLSGVMVTFTESNSGSAGATLSSGTAVTDANGVASVTAVANLYPGSYTVTASARGVFAPFSLTNVAAVLSTITASPTGPQSVLVGEQFPLPLQVTATDSSGIPVSGVVITFTAPGSGASAVLSSGTALTNASGVASVTATANKIPGSYQVKAATGALSLTFSLTNVAPSTTSVTLQTSTNPSTFGSPLTLTGTVSNSTATGKVTFFDGVAILGTKAASAGIASLSTILLPAGTHKLTAYYQDDVNAVVGTSNAVTETVRAVAGGAFITTSPTRLNPAGSSAAVADFNGDGKVDVVVTGPIPDIGGGITGLLGKGDGSFLPPVDYFSSPGNFTVFTAAGDFNGDGNTDLAVSAGGSVNILLGNGDGTFRPPLKYAAIGSTIAVADFNGDGKPDIVLAYEGQQFVPQDPSALATVLDGYYIPFTGVNILPGNGDGTFGAPIIYPTLPAANTANFVVADFNGDGKPDLAFASFVVLGNGDGTIQTPIISLPGVTGTVTSLVAGDFNGDGKTDLALGGLASGTHAPTTWILPGKGDGTFQSPVSYPLGAAMTSGDFNGDGITDLVVADSSGNMSGVLYGKGDGTFQAGVAFSAGAPLAVTDFNSDGKADILTANGANGTVTVLLGATPVNNGSGPPASITASAGTPQSTVLDAAFPNALQVTVKDANGMPVGGASVTFTAPSAGASASLSSVTALTNASGVASVTATANNIAGSYIVKASVTVFSFSTSFSLTNLIGASNLAQGKAATQSSTYPGYVSAGAASAVDGNTDGNFFDGSVTATNLDPNAWWQVDLGASTAISSVVIWNRTDCCATRLNDFWVFISNTPFLPTETPSTLQNRSGTFSSHQTGAPSPSTIIAANSAQGRYVRVQLSGTDYLSLAEVQVFAGTNLALGKPATQTDSLQSNSGAALAVDGNTDGSFYDGSVATTSGRNLNDWWQVDLGVSATVSSVVVWNRTDCCGSRLNDYWVFVSDTPFLPAESLNFLQSRPGTFASHQTAAPNPFTVIVVEAQGRYVRVQLSGQNYLSLAEVQVFGTAGLPPTNLAQGKSASQSSTYPGYASAAAASAVDGNTDGNFFDGSVTATNADQNAWWQVDLGASAAVSSIVVWNRTDCCSARLGDYWVFVSDTPFLPTDTPGTLQNRAGTFSSHQSAAPGPSTTIAVAAQGRYVRVQLSGANYLSLAEVQVFGQ